MEGNMADVTENRPIAVNVSGVKKMYKLGQIGGGSLQADLQSWWARVRGKEDPNSKIGEGERSHGKTFMALNGVDLTIYQGEAVGIIGSNGAGKSTLLKLLSKVTAPTEGEIDIYGRIASMLEVGTGFNPEMTGRENVYLNGAILGMTKAEIDAKMEDIIEFSEVREFIDTPVKRYSSGMFVKLAFSVAAHLDSEIMIMDEVLAVGDMAFQKKCLDKMREAAKQEGRTVLYVSHNMNTIRTLCDRCIVLQNGKLIFQGDVESAIDMYLNNSTIENEVDMDLANKAHVDGECSFDIVMNHLVLLNKTVPIYYNEERMKLKFKLTVKKPLENVRFRLTLRDDKDAAVATAWSSPIVFSDSGIKEIIFDFGMQGVEKGILYSSIGFYIIDDGGNFIMLDHITRAFRIEVIQKPQSSSIIWSPTYWGYLRLPDIGIETVRDI